MKKMLISVISCLLFVTLSWSSIGIDVTANVWDVGEGAAGTWVSPDIKVTNTGDEQAEIHISASDSTDWTLGTAPGENIFSLQYGDGSL